MLKVLFFASVRESAGCDCLELPWVEGMTLGSLREQLMAENAQFRRALQEPLLMARNQSMGQADTLVRDGDEVAYFPPVTGG